MVAVGEQAPGFTLRNQHSQPVSLAQFAGAKTVVLAFFPFAFTGTCTGELCAIRDDLASFDNDDTAILAVSCDSLFSLRAFADREGYSFPLLSDFWPHGEVARAYGVFSEVDGRADRGTFIIDPAGVVRWTVRHPMGQPRDPAEYRRVLAELRG
jgi:peroxiredoxin (alkyl hydroperoxide reductase subunit C)